VLRSIRLAATTAVVAALVSVVGLAASPASATTKIPDQFIAKMYTEVLGRAPDPSGWSFHRSSFAGTGCDAASLAGKVREFFGTAEFGARGYDNAEKMLVAYRAILNREADTTGLNTNRVRLDTGTPLTTIIDEMLASPEFTGLATIICNTSTAGYGFDDSGQPVDLPNVGTGFRGTQAQLQALLDATPPGGTVTLARHTVIRLSSSLFIPGGVTLTTAGAPSKQSYAAMARLTREPGWVGPSVQLVGSAKLDRVWASGARGRESGWNRDRATVLMLGGDGTAVVSSRLSEPSGASSLRSAGTGDGLPCFDNVVRDNLVTSYTAEFTSVRQSDGLSIGCEDTLVQNNAVIDATDVAIVVFPVSATVPQASRVTGNTVIHAGISAQGSIAVDSLFASAGDAPGTASRSFVGGSIDGNTLWMGGSVTAQIAVSVGGRPWYGSNGLTFTGGSVTGNTSAGLPVRAASIIAVSGALNTTVSNNSFTSVLIPSASPCPSQSFGASTSAGYASGTLPGSTNALYYGCITFP
jgi:hypothetical protein